MTFEEYRAEKLAAGFDEVLVREWQPHEHVVEHAHPFLVEAEVVRGEMWLACGALERRLVAGERFTVAAHAEHAERYGDEGATLWIARRYVRGDPPQR